MAPTAVKMMRLFFGFYGILALHFAVLFRPWRQGGSKGFELVA
jgi:hypothetical protein